MPRSCLPCLLLNVLWSRLLRCRAWDIWPRNNDIIVYPLKNSSPSASYIYIGTIHVWEWAVLAVVWLSMRDGVQKQRHFTYVSAVNVMYTDHVRDRCWHILRCFEWSGSRSPVLLSYVEAWSVTYLSGHVNVMIWYYKDIHMLVNCAVQRWYEVWDAKLLRNLVDCVLYLLCGIEDEGLCWWDGSSARESQWKYSIIGIFWLVVAKLRSNQSAA